MDLSYSSISTVGSPVIETIDECNDCTAPEKTPDFQTCQLFFLACRQFLHKHRHSASSTAVHSEYTEVLPLIQPWDQASHSIAAPVSLLMVYNGIAAQLRELTRENPRETTSLQCLFQSCCISVLSSRQMCSCTHSVTWGQLYCFMFRCSWEKTVPTPATHTCTSTV